MTFKFDLKDFVHPVIEMEPTVPSWCLPRNLVVCGGVSLHLLLRRATSINLKVVICCASLLTRNDHAAAGLEEHQPRRAAVGALARHAELPRCHHPRPHGAGGLHARNVATRRAARSGRARRGALPGGGQACAATRRPAGFSSETLSCSKSHPGNCTAHHST